MNHFAWGFFGILGALAYYLIHGASIVSTDGAPAIPSGAGNSGADPFYQYDGLFKTYGAQYGVAPSLLKAIAMGESSLGTNPRVARGLASPSDPASVSSDGKSYGLMQETLPTANDMRPGTTMEDLNNPEISVEIAAQYFAHLQGMFGAEQDVIEAYNEGPGNVQKGVDDSVYYNKFLKNRATVLQRQPDFDN